MTKLDLIRMIGDVLTEVDVLRADFPRKSESRIRLDNLRDNLDASQRQLVRSVIKESTPQFKTLTKQVGEINEGLTKTIDDENRVAETLESLFNIAGVVQKIVALAA